MVWHHRRLPEMELMRAAGQRGQGNFCSNCRQFVELKNGLCPLCGSRPAGRMPLWKAVLLYAVLVIVLLFIISILFFLLA